MAKYKVGDRVRVRYDLQASDNVYYQMEDGSAQDNVSAVMLYYVGKVVTIDKVSLFYKIKDDNQWNWTDEMFLCLVDENGNDVKEDKKMTKIKSYKVFNNTAMVVEFEDGDVQKAVCNSEDKFDLERGLEVCLVKRALGGEDKYKALIRDGLRDIKAIDKAAKMAEEEAELIARKKAKAAARKAKKLARRKEERIEEQKEAYLRAMREVGKE